jgi:hypothetical protein
MASTERLLMTRIRITIPKSGDPAAELQYATQLQQMLLKQAPVWLDPDYPLRGIHRDLESRAYLEFATDQLDEVQRILREHSYENRVAVTESHEPLGQECINCGNIAGPFLPTVCPSCHLRDISPCPSCGQEVSRDQYVREGGDWFRCPNCRHRVRLRFNEPVFRSDERWNEPLVIVADD